MAHPGTRHGAPDLMLCSNLWELPQGVAPGDEVTAGIIVMNVGDRKLPEGEMVARGGGRVVGRASYPAMQSFDGRAVKLKLRIPKDWRKGEPLEISVTAPVAGDPLPENNTLSFHVLRKIDPALAGRTRPIRVDFSKIKNIRTIENIAEEPYEVELASTSLWHRFKAPDKGRLHVEAEGVFDDTILGVELYGENGLPLSRREGVWRLSGQYIYIRIAVRPGVAPPKESKIRISWR